MKADRIFTDVPIQVVQDESLAPYTSFRIGGPARYFSQPRFPEEIPALMRRATDAGVPLFILGGGSNLLIDDAGVPGLVLQMSHLRWFRQEEDALHVGPGVPLSALVKKAANNGLAGFGRFAGIPGYVGGSIQIKPSLDLELTGSYRTWDKRAIVDYLREAAGVLA